MRLLLPLALLSVAGSVNGEEGGSSVSGMSVSCFSALESCLAQCQMSCYIVDHCNDSESEMVACAPDVMQMIILTLVFVVAVLSCCCLICFCSPCCCLAVWWRRRKERQRNSSSLAQTQQQETFIQKA